MIEHYWVANPAKLLQKCSILGLNSVNDLSAFLGEDTQWNAFQIYDQNRKHHLGGSAFHEDTIKAAVQELRHPSVKYDIETQDTSEWRSKEWKVFYIITIINENHEDRWAEDIGSEDAPELVYGVLCLLVFMQDAFARKRKPYHEIMTFRNQTVAPSPVNQLQAPSSSSKSRRTSQPSKAKNERVARDPVNDLQNHNVVRNPPVQDCQRLPALYLPTKGKYYWGMIALAIAFLIFALYGVWMMFGSRLWVFVRKWLSVFTDRLRKEFLSWGHAFFNLCDEVLELILGEDKAAGEGELSHGMFKNIL